LIDRSTQKEYAAGLTDFNFFFGEGERVHINHFAVVVAAIATFVIGGVWYSPLLFHKAWMHENGMNEADLKKTSMGRIFGLSFGLSLIMAYNLAAFLGGPDTTVLWGATAGALAGIGWVALSIGILGLFERRSWKYVLINGGYFGLSFVVMGTIIGAWR
jgi:uncharacterized protein DUF1761